MPSPAATALADQFDAATREALGVLHAIARREHETVITGPPSPWLSSQVRTLLHALATGQTHACPHITDSPQRAHAAVWAPGVITCPACRHLLDPGPLEDNVCDRCRVAAHALTPCMAAVGPVLLAFGLCSTCADVIDPADPRPSRKPRR